MRFSLLGRKERRAARAACGPTGRSALLVGTDRKLSMTESGKPEVGFTVQPRFRSVHLIVNVNDTRLNNTRLQITSLPLILNGLLARYLRYTRMLHRYTNRQVGLKEILKTF